MFQAVLCHQGELSWHTAPRTAGVHTHGTGCTFSAAIATGSLSLAFGDIAEAYTIVDRMGIRTLRDPFIEGYLKMRKDAPKS